MNTTKIVFGPSDKYHRRRAREMRREMTPAESALWQRLRADRLAHLHFRRQQVIDGRIVDFYCHEVGLVVEVDGEVHHGREQEDARRDDHLRERGLAVLRFANEDIFGRMELVLAQIEQAAEDRRQQKRRRSAPRPPVG